ncbi:MAG: acetylglutamate kinase [Nitrospirota bacterium]|nr:acetylglutamate kinase [Nitrospirota bacterium]
MTRPGKHSDKRPEGRPEEHPGDTARRARILVEALPYLRAFHGRTVVIKYGGAAMVDDDLKHQFAEDVVLLKYVGINPVVVHGGGPKISATMQRLGLEARFVDGVRVTDAATMEVVEMVLGGVVNKEIVNRIQRHGGNAVGLTGKDGNLIRARPMRGADGKPLELGQVGEVEAIDPLLLTHLDHARFIPVIAPIGVDATGLAYNINADLVAGAVAHAIQAEKLIVLTDVSGILDAAGELCSTLTRQQVDRMIAAGTLKGGMLPKVRACFDALDGGVAKAHIIDGRVPHALLLELFTDTGVGTEIITEAVAS